ncbi:hypothetical protein JHK87_040231 [Glycine soja]|nr:hypothetical protein JHK87_040231 [Glycine soja]
MARDMLAILVFTLASESVFSTKGRVLDPNCCSLTPQMMETLVCTQDWIKRTPSPLPSNENEEFLEFEIIEEANLVIPSCRPVKVWQKLQVYARGNDVNLTDYKGKVLLVVNVASQWYVIMSFIPDLHNMAWVSIVAAIMSFTCSSIGLGLGITTIIGKVHFHN